MEKYISVNKESMEKLRRIFGKVGKPLCERTVKNALNFESDSELARKIRYCAKHNFFGVTYVVEREDMVCFFDSDGLMHQVFGNGAELYFDCKEGEIKLYHKGDVVRRWGNILLTDIPELQATAAAL